MVPVLCMSLREYITYQVQQVHLICLQRLHNGFNRILNASAYSWRQLTWYDVWEQIQEIENNLLNCSAIYWNKNTHAKFIMYSTKEYKYELQFLNKYYIS